MRGFVLGYEMCASRLISWGVATQVLAKKMVAIMELSKQGHYDFSLCSFVIPIARAAGNTFFSAITILYHVTLCFFPSLYFINMLLITCYYAHSHAASEVIPSRNSRCHNSRCHNKETTMIPPLQNVSTPTPSVNKKYSAEGHL